MIMPSSKVIRSVSSLRRLKNFLLRPLFYIQRARSTRMSLSSLKNFDKDNMAEDLESAIAHMRRVVELCPNGHHRRAASLDQLSILIRKRYDQAGKVEDVEEEISLHQEALQLRPTGHPDRVISLNSLSTVTRVRFEMLGELKDINDSIDYAQQALALSPDSDQRAKSLGNLGSALGVRFEHGGKKEDLEASIEHFHDLLRIRPVGHPARHRAFSDLANSMRLHFRETGNMDDLAKAVDFSREALAACPLEDQERSMIIGNLVGILLTRFTQTGGMVDLEESIDLSRQALDMQPPGHPDRPLTLGNLPIALLLRFGETGRMEDLEDCIQLFRESLELFPEGHPDRAMGLSNLASAILARFQQAGRIEDSDEGINMLRQTLPLLPDDHPYRAESMMNLAAAVLQRYEVVPSAQALDEAVDLGQKTLDALPPEHTYRAAVLHSYAGALAKRFQLSRQLEDIEKAILLNEEVLTLWPPGHPERSNSLKDLALALVQRFEHGGSKDDLDKAFELVSNAEEELSLDNPKHTDVRLALASVLLKLYRADPSNDKHLHTAFDFFEKATHHSSASVKSRFTACLEWIAKAREYQDSSLISAYAISLTLLTRFLLATPSVELQHKFLQSTSTIPKTLASDAAAAAVDAGRLETAVEFLEQGRSMLWSEMRNFRPPLEQLREVSPTLADELRELTTQLEHQATSFEATSTLNESPVPLEVRQKKHRILSDRVDDLLTRVRKLEGFADFLKVVSFQTLRMAAVEGPVIVINISQHRSDAIIVHDTQDPYVVQLSDIHLETLADFASYCADPTKTRDEEFPKWLRQVLQTLWKMVVGPIVDHLTLTLTPKSRIWWCPTSYLCALPLHAAGPYLPKQRNLPDIYVSSYTSTLSVLITARSQKRQDIARSRPDLFVITDVGQPGAELHSAQEELTRIQKHNGAATIAFGENANRDNVLSCLPQHHWVHFVCHGHREKESFRSWFQLYGNERLELIELIHARLPNAELAFLSACHTAAVDAQGTPDEVIHLAAALQFCGFQSVIGTLWAMVDEDGPDVADSFYGYMFPEDGNVVSFKESAVALNIVTKEMRRRKVPLDRWVNFVHIGA
ncbi:hypothetical protein QCA50_017911 [Cerrena zonata]|uniref:CHAT domain-containing protein n=1 Tax=Cerrena zonata TaxID=2478898 RepID=A0AAW0FBX3_9APHY